jgi:cell division protein ZapA (FtsZ GTPase activity inhibitor)
MSNQKKLTVSILGRNYSLLTDENHVIVEEAASLISSHLQEIGGNSSTSPADLVRKTTFVALKIAVDSLKKDLKTSNINDLLKSSSL